MNEQQKTANRRCQAKTNGGRHCCAHVVSGTRYCPLHGNPQKAAELGRKGGLKNRHYLPLDEQPLPIPITATDVRCLLAEVMAQVRAGRLDPKIATTVAYLAGPLLKTIETSELEERLRKLEEELQDEAPKEED
jgi:hypothetical protein